MDIILNLKKGDILAGFLYVFLFYITYYLIKNGMLAWFNISHPYMAGFLQFFIYATAGELISTRIIASSWKFDKILIFKALVWGIGGIIITLNFKIFFIGIKGAMEEGLLPFRKSPLALAFYTSSASNLMYGPIHSAFTITMGVYLELRMIKKQAICVYDAINTINWEQFVKFIILKCILFFWIPVNTMTFLLPNEYRVICAAILSLFFGILVTMHKLYQIKVLKK
jgi:hypothetical protein